MQIHEHDYRHWMPLRITNNAGFEYGHQRYKPQCLIKYAFGRSLNFSFAYVCPGFQRNQNIYDIDLCDY